MPQRGLVGSMGERSEVLSGAVLGAAYGAAGAFTASLVEDPTLLQRHLTLTGSAFLVLVMAFYILLRRAERARLPTPPPMDGRGTLEGHDEGRGRWRQLSHVRQEAAGWRIDLHDLTDVEGVVDTVGKIADRHHIKLIVGDGTARSADPRLRARVEQRLRSHLEPARIRHGKRSLSTLPLVAMQHGGSLRLPTLLMSLSIVFVALLLLR